MIPDILNYSLKKHVKWGDYFISNYYIFYDSFPFKEHFQKLHFKNLTLVHYSYEVSPNYYFLTVWHMKTAE